MLFVMNELDVKSLRLKLCISQDKLAEMLGVSLRTIQNWESGTKIPSSKHAILHKLMLDPDKIEYSGGGDDIAIPNIVPLLPISAQGGTLNDFVVGVKGYDCEMVVSPIKGADFAMSVAGESMSPEYPAGSQILIKRIDEKAFVDWGKVYVLDTINGTVIKKLMPSAEQNKVRCVSINPDYPEFVIDMSSVFGVYRVLLCMSIK